jgi:uncharacterized protein
MLVSRRVRRIILGLCLYLAFSAILGIFVAAGALHPERRPLTDDEVATAHRLVQTLDAGLEDASITTPEGVVLRAWLIHPRHSNGNAVIALHGLGDNRIGTLGYAQLLVTHGYVVLMPDARAHGASGGELATYGLLERNDIRNWFDFLQAKEHPACIFGFGESMGAAQLLQSLDAGTHFCAIAAESSFADFREIAYDRMGQPFHLGPWIGRTIFRPLVEFAFLRARWKYGLNMNRVSPVGAVAATTVPVLLIHGQIDSNIPVRHSRLIHSQNPATELWEVPHADHCGAISTAPEEFKRRLLGWYDAHTQAHLTDRVRSSE